MNKREYLYVDGFKFGFHKLLSGNKKRWRCVNRNCYSYIKTDVNEIIIDQRLDHRMHDLGLARSKIKKMNDSANNSTHVVCWENRQLCINKLLENLFASQSMTDTTIICSDQRLSAHKFILSASSDYFHRCFAHLNTVDHPVLIFKEIPYRHMKLLLEFMYKGSISISSKEYEAVQKSARYLEIKSFLNDEQSDAVDTSARRTPDYSTSDTTSDFALSRIVDTIRQSNVANSTGGIITTNRFVNNKTQRIFDSNEVTLSIKTKNPEENKFRSLLEETPSVEIVRSSSNQNQVNNNYSVSMNIKEENFNSLIPIVELREPQSTDNYVWPETEMSSMETMLQCKHCNETFADEYNLNVHLKKVHEKIYKPYTCEYCHINFTRSSHLQRHRRQHTGERPFVCTQCGRAFARGDKLKHHFTLAHADIEYVPKTKRNRSTNNNNNNNSSSNNNNSILSSNSIVGAQSAVSLLSVSKNSKNLSPNIPENHVNDNDCSSTDDMSRNQDQRSLSSSLSPNNTNHIKEEIHSDAENDQNVCENNIAANQIGKKISNRKRTANKMPDMEYGMRYFFNQNFEKSEEKTSKGEPENEFNADDIDHVEVNGDAPLVIADAEESFVVEPNIEISMDESGNNYLSS